MDDMIRRSAEGRAWSRIEATARRVADCWPWTPLGMSLALVAAVALFGFGIARLDLVLLVLGYGSAGVLALATLIVGLSAALLKLWLRRTRFSGVAQVFETGSPCRTDFWLPSLRWVPLLQVRWEWTLAPHPRVDSHLAQGRMNELVTFSRRGIVQRAQRRIVVQDAFGLARLALRHEQTVLLEVRPHAGAMRRLPVLTSLTGGEDWPHPLGIADGDRVELRRYVAGDPARFIHWKVFGRTRKLMVKTPERSLSRALRTAAYLIADPTDEAAAAAARLAVEQEGLGAEWQFGADGASQPCSDPDTALSKIVASADFQGRAGSGLANFVAAVDAKGPAALVVFAAPVQGPWLDEIRAVTQKRSGQVRVVLALDAIHDGPSFSRWRRWLFAPRPVAGASRAELETVSAVLRRLGCEVVLIDRISGRVFGDVTAMTQRPERRAA